MVFRKPNPQLSIQPEPTTATERKQVVYTIFKHKENFSNNFSENPE